ncbi:MAG: Txe/YoeB family addiction module toxin [Ruminiclostridium sp.]|nr:Txe/YoeB family addiction module toxin [Ruminiclostridium sp.]
MRKLLWDNDAWEEYLQWLEEDRKTLKRINKLLNDIRRDPFDGIGKPEALKDDLRGFWSRRINEEHRIVYSIDDNIIRIFSCKGHYTNKTDKDKD